ncbi:MAG: VCBS repeat-containing protein [Planctomycetota bacterium]
MSRAWITATVFLATGLLLFPARSLVAQMGYEVLRPLPEWDAEWLIAYVRGGPDLDADGYDDLLVHYTGGRLCSYCWPVVAVMSGIDGHVLAKHLGEENLYAGGQSDFADLNGDGIVDLVLGWAHVSNPAGTGSGHIMAKTIDGTGTYWSRYADDGVAGFGSALRTAGDLDGDGCDDVLVYAPSWTGHPNVGRIAVLAGRDGSTLYEYEGTMGGEGFGERVHHGVGDFDGDGYGDFVIGSSFRRSVVWIHSGRTGELIRSIVGTDGFGRFIATPGDLNGDGLADVVIGSVSALFAYTLVQDDPLWEWHSDDDPPGLGNTSELADVNDDGVGDVLLGLPWKKFKWHSDGAVLILSGKTGETLIETRGTRQEEGSFGHDVTGLGDLDGDGQADWVARDKFQPPSESTVLVYTRETLRFRPADSFFPWNLHIKVPARARDGYLLLFALSADKGVPLGGRRIPLDPDPVFIWSLAHPVTGVLDHRGEDFLKLPDGLFGGGVTAGEVSAAAVVLNRNAPLGVSMITTRARLAPY